MERHLTVIGGGPAGVEAAVTAANHGARVTLVSDGPVGGRAGWHSLIPSKVLLHAAQEAQARGDVGATADGVHQIIRHIADTCRAWSSHEAVRLQQAGVELLTGQAHFTSRSSVVVQEPDGTSQVLAFDSAIVATGSVPVFPDGLQPDGQRIIAPRLVGKLERIPATMLVVGGGVTGSEFVFAFAALGAHVTWLVDQYGVLPPFDRRPVQTLIEAFLGRGVELVEGVAVQQLEPSPNAVSAILEDGRRFEAEQAFVAIGRRPDLQSLVVQAAGLPPALDGAARGGLAVDALCRTAVPQIYAVGDVTGAPLVVNKGLAQARVAGITAAGVATEPFRASSLVQAVYSAPQLAQVGLTPDAAARADRAVEIRRVPFAHALRAHLEPEGPRGELELVLDPQRGQTVLGATAVGPSAAEVLALVALAIHTGVRADSLAALYPAHPTLAELPGIGSRGIGSRS